MHADFLEQAWRLARIDPGKPKQANLRRALSAAYYALFHFLADQACRELLGSQPERKRHRAVLARAFEHGAMRDACTAFAGGALSPRVTGGLPAGVFFIPAEIRTLASRFKIMQELRHRADYDLTACFVRSQVLAELQAVEGAIRQFTGLPASVERSFFLACLWAYPGLARR